MTMSREHTFPTIAIGSSHLSKNKGLQVMNFRNLKHNISDYMHQLSAI
jgi:hypothetical protein